jgi:hypothetical protein
MTEDGVVPAKHGPSRRPAGENAKQEAANLHPADLSVALRAAVSRVGAAGPPAGGLARVRRKAKVRQRNHAVLAGSAGVVMIVMGVTVATGDRFSIVPALTGVVGLGNNGNSTGQQPGGQSGQGASAAGETSHAVWPSPGASGSAKTGPAIGPGAPPTIAPSPTSAQIPLCSAATLNMSTTLGVTDGDVRYGEIDVVPQSICLASNPPVLEVTNAAGNAAASVQIMPATAADQSAAPGLPIVPGSGHTAVLQPGQAYEFQFAWVAPACAQPTASPAASAGPTPAPTATAYSLQYAVPGSTSVSGVTLDASCGAQVYVTDVYVHGAYPIPTPTPVPPTPTASPSASTPSSPGTPTDSSAPAPTIAVTGSPSAPQSDGKAVAVSVSAASIKKK